MVVVLALRIRPRMPSRAWWFTLVVLLIMTAVFDAMIIGFGVVDYNSAKLLGLFVGNVPIEDFFYAVLAVMIVPVLWRRLEFKR